MTAAPKLTAPPSAAPPDAARTITVAVAGNPNSGKSTLINAIAGSRLHVGNWPGVTVEKKEAAFEHAGRRIRLVDLPGTYSLSPYSQEEIVARDYLAHERPDVIVNVVDATNLERNLYLTVQLLELGIPVVMALNIYDEAEAKGYRLDVRGIEARLGVRVVPTSATRKTGLEELLGTVVSTADRSRVRTPVPLSYGPDLDGAAVAVAHAVAERHPEVAERYAPRWLALKLIEGDARVLEETGIDRPALVAAPLEHLVKAHGEDVEAIVAEARYGLAAGLTREVLEKPRLQKTELTERIDRVVLNRFLGIPIFLAAMWLVFKLTFDLSAPFGDWIDAMTSGPFKRWAAALLGAIGRAGLDGVARERRHHRGRRVRARLRPRHLRDDVLHHLPGGLGLHGARRLRDGQGDARDGAPREVVHPDGARLRLQRPGRLRHADARERARPDPHRAPHPAHVLRRAAPGVRAVRRRVLPRSGRAR